MTKISISSRKLFSLTVILSAVLISGCGKQIQSSISKIDNLSSEMPVGIIGGERVENSLDANEFERKLLYLALGVKQQGSKISWSGHCTASAISSRVVLTAAHCVEGQLLQSVRVVLTKNPTQTALKLNEWYMPKVIRVHEAYTGKNGFLNDLALILLDRDLPKNRISKLADSNQIEFPMEFVAIGYGTTSTSSDPSVSGKQSSILNYVIKTVEGFDLNQKTFSINQNDHKGFCSGDSGGPGLIYDPETHEHWILGVVSNVSMLDQHRKMVDPQKQYSLCIGQGNYVNVLNPELNEWIQSTHELLMAQI